jgi:hypothetical protein
MAATERLKAYFLQELGAAHTACYPQYLEQRFPHVFENIVTLWGTAELDDYFQDLLLTTRPGRQGFPTEAAEEILRLYTVYHESGAARPEGPGQGTAWDWVDHLDYFDKARSH